MTVTTPAPAHTAAARRAELLRLVAVVVAALAVVAGLRLGAARLSPEPLATAATSDVALAVTDLEETGPDDGHVRIAVELENRGTEPVVVDAGAFRMMRGTHMVPVVDPASVPETLVEPGESVTVEPRFLAPFAGDSPRLEVALPDGSVATLLLPPAGDTPPDPTAGTAPHADHG